MIRLVLPKPPSSNSLFPTNRKTGRRFKSAQYQRWIKISQGYLLAQWPKLLPHVPMLGALNITIRLPEKTRGDIDNLAKAPLDFLVASGVTGDDKHHRSVTITRDASVSECVVEIREGTA